MKDTIITLGSIIEKEYVCAKLLQLCLTLCEPMDHQAPLFMGFSSYIYHLLTLYISNC